MGVEWVEFKLCFGLKVFGVCACFTYRLRVDGMHGKYCARDEGELSLKAGHTVAGARKEDTDGRVQKDVGQMEQLRPQTEEQIVESAKRRTIIWWADVERSQLNAEGFVGIATHIHRGNQNGTKRAHYI